LTHREVLSLAVGVGRENVRILWKKRQQQIFESFHLILKGIFLHA